MGKEKDDGQGLPFVVEDGRRVPELEFAVLHTARNNTVRLVGSDVTPSKRIES